MGSIAELESWRDHCQGSVHFVPTMGALHRGHGELIRVAIRQESDQPVNALVSVFVNPLQFGPSEDFVHYPRDLEADRRLVESAGASAFWAPSVEEIFPADQVAQLSFEVPASLQDQLCGAVRPGHFDGVAKVITRLLALVRPDVLFLGEKDWQQLTIVRALLSDLGWPGSVRGVATVRDQDGLACSSRNRYLTPSEREKVLLLPQLLVEAARQAGLGRMPDPAALSSTWEAAGLEVEYVQTVDPHSLQPTGPTRKLCLLAAALRCGNTRLIDHTFLMTHLPIVAIDGPAGAGKSTVTRGFAERLGLIYLDTGAMYRAVTWWIQRKGMDPTDAAGIAIALENLELELGPLRSGSQTVQINGHQVTEAIRSPEVTGTVSVVAAHVCVRKALTEQQQEMGVQGGLVAEGRDIGTAVFPQAELKVFLTATSAERARRRARDLQSRGFPVPDLAQLQAEIEERDRLDSTRTTAPLVKADDAIELVTDAMTIEEVIAALVDLFRCKVPEEVWPTDQG
ncbi:MAG: bifunctional pantoate--beta-alanine ligase/(d)CMP kinase [Prochlorococcus sp.]|nr:bifunctional pantoate--beta-alanine ligase/(d)CMP kinase [Prochlorococcaceae cyanobacterium Fu_MAG_50]